MSLKTNFAASLASNPAVLSEVSALDSALQNEGRVLLRPSGTEPLLRVMVEGQDFEQVQLYAKDLVDKIKKIQAQQK